MDPPFIGFKLLSGVVGNKMANEYLLNIHLSKDFIIEGVTACEAPNLEDSEFLIGMDIINMGDFAITNVSKKTSLSYRQPSLFRINFQTDKEKAIKEKELLVKKQNKATLKTKKNRKRKRKGKSKKFRK